MTAHFGWQNENSANNRGKNTSLANAAANIVATSMAKGSRRQACGQKLVASCVATSSLVARCPSRNQIVFFWIFFLQKSIFFPCCATCHQLLPTRLPATAFCHASCQYVCRCVCQRSILATIVGTVFASDLAIAMNFCHACRH